MELNALQAKAQAFLDLHQGPRILVLPNAWDAASARIFEEAGFPAVATTSAGVANSLGYPDGQRIPRSEMLDVVGKIARTVSVPVSADMEAGYASTPKGVAETARAVIAAGAIGMNFEDGTGIRDRPLEALDLQVEKIRAIREAANSLGVHLVLNARTDVYLAQAGEPSTQADEAIRRANAYRQAGADCLFIPGVADAETIAMLAHEIHGPINILAGPSTPPALELERLGVARMSTGSGPMRATMTLVRRIARDLRETGRIKSFIQGSITHTEANRLFETAGDK
ncbi:MAG: isocitrate lyase/PEP mutase family protein [Terriglobia bacterium]